MTGKRWLILAAVGSLLGGTGCVNCNHHTHKMAVDVGPECPLPLADRQRVYLFLVNGLTPGCGLDSLRDEVSRQGFPKIACGQLVHIGWMANEMRRIHADDPGARFVMLGYDAGGPAAARLASDAVADGLSVDAVVLLDPLGKCDTFGASRTVLVTSATATGSGPTPHSESVPVPDASHFKLPTHPQTVAVVLSLLTESAARARPTDVPMPVIELTYEHAPPPRAITAPGLDAPAEWNFLLDLPGHHTDPLQPIDSPPAVIPTVNTGLAPQLHNSSVTRPRL